MHSWLPRLDRHFLRGSATLLAVAAALTVTGLLARDAVWDQRNQVKARAAVTVSRQALSFEEQVARQLLTLDQSLGVMARAWERDPADFDLQDWHGRTIALNGISWDVMLVDENGIVRQSSIPEAIGGNVSEDDYFQYVRAHGTGEDRLFVGGATIGTTMRQWHMNVARWLHRPDGSFAGVLVTDYRLAAIAGLLRQADLGAGGMLALVGLTDGKLRAHAGPGAAEPDTSIIDSPMFAAIRDGDRTWIGRSAPDATPRVLAFRRVPNRDLVAVAGMDLDEAMAPADAWEWQTKLFAGFIAALLCLLALLVLRGIVRGRRRETAQARDRAVLAAANAQLEVAKAYADAKAAQLAVTLAGMTDGVSMIDGHLCLLEWNARFPEVTGAPAEILRVGMPMEEVLFAQARAGQFGPVDPDAEVARRMAALQAGRAHGTIERRRPDGRIIELRRNRLPDGGFVTLYADITERKRTEQALREARAAADGANEAKSRFVAIVSHEIRTPLSALLDTLHLLADSPLAPTQRILVDTARQAGDGLLALLNDILDTSSMEAGQLALRPSVFALRPLLESAIETFLPQAGARGIVLECDVAPDVPAELFTDPGRLRQVLLNLVSNAVKFGRPGEVMLLARRGDPDIDGLATLRLAVRDRGPAIPPEERSRLFRPFSRIERVATDAPLGTGLGLAICLHLVGLMGGSIDCSPWTDEQGRSGNEFWIRLPIPALPIQGKELEQPADAARQRLLPRTRILLVEDIAANQVVTATLLRREGHAVDVASDGQAAIEAVERHAYDLVLMDFFMPGLSGPETVRRIRDMRGLADALPILALTANVSPEDRAVARQAGMDGLLGKPVALRDLLDAIALHVWRGVPERGEANREQHEAEDDAGPMLAARRIEELRANLPADTLRAMIEECLEELGQRLPTLRHALEDGNAAEIAAQTHAMAGVAAGYGMAGLEARLRALMASGQDFGGRDARELAQEMEATLRATARAMRAVMQNEMA